MNNQLTLSQIIERIERIISVTAGGKVVFLATPMIQDAVIRNFTVLGQLSVRLDWPLPWGRLAGFDDAGVDVDLELIWNMVDQELGPLESEVRLLVEA